MKIPIIGASLLKFGDLWNDGIDDLIREAGKKALDSSGLKSSDIDSLFLSNVFSSKTNGMSLLSSIAFEELEIDNAVCISAGDASGAAAINQAASSILSGKETAMVIGAEKMSDFKASDMLALSSELISPEEAMAGATVQSQFAMMARKYLHDFRLNQKALSFIPSKNHSNAMANEFAQYRLELPEEKINSSPLASDPIRMLDCASYCDGAAALIMCSKNAAKKFKSKINGYLLASCLSNDSLSLSKRNSIISIESSSKASEKAFEMAAISSEKIGLMELHDAFPISEVLAVEDLGFAKKGKGIEFIRKNYKKINQSGGLKACGHAPGATGVRQAVDIVKRLGKNDLKYGLSQTLAGTGAVSVVSVFGAG